MSAIRIAFFLFLLSGPASAESDIGFNESNGLFTVRHRTIDIVKTDFVFWDANWKWAEANVQAHMREPASYTLQGDFDRLNLELTGTVEKTAPGQMTWTFDFVNRFARRNAIGGGIEFQFDLEALKASGIDSLPQLLPNQAGWRIKIGGKNEYLTVRFDPPIKRVFFERGNKDEIRAFFYAQTIEAGHNHVRMKVTLPTGGRVAPTLAERLGAGPDENWYRDIVYWATSPLDLSFLNEPERPAGKHGFVRAVEENLVFEDGTPAKFWGTNVQAYALFRTNSVDVRRQAKRLSKLGFNLVRIHHHDSPWVQPNIFGNNSKNTLNLNEAALKKIDWWIKCLRDEGIYIWLDLQVERNFAGEDGIRDSSEIPRQLLEEGAKGYNYVNDDIQQLMRQFNEAYLNHVNPNTGLAYKDDPAIIAVLISNENDLTHHFGNRLLPNKKVPRHNKRYMAASRKFALENTLPANKTWLSWQHGPSKIFLNDLEHRFNEKMIQHLRNLGLKAPIASTNFWGYMPISSLPSLSAGDLIDAHAYGEPNEIEANPRHRATIFSWLASGQIPNTPYSISEWNLSPFPALDRNRAPLHMAAIARLQGWDAIMLYGYAQSEINSDVSPSNWQAFNDPGLLSTLPAAALMYRQEHVQEAENTYALKLDRHTFFYKEVSPKTSAAIRTITEQSRLVIELPETPELPWLTPTKSSDDAIIVTDPDRDFLPPGQNFVRSDTGEIYRNWEDGILTVNTDRSQVAAGWLGGQSVALQDISVDLVTKNAVIAVQSLNEQPIRDSNNILISFSARSIPSPGNKLPFLSEPVEGRLRIRAREGLKLFALDRGGKEKPVAVISDAGHYVIQLSHKLGTYWLKLRAPDNGAKIRTKNDQK